MKVFPDLKWGTRDPVAFKDSELGLIRLRAFGMFNIRVVQPLLFINSLVGTVAAMNTQSIEEYLGRVIVSRLNDYMGEHLHSILDLPGKYDQWADGLQQQLEKDFTHFGLELTHLYIQSITPTPEVQQAIDDRSKLGLFDDLSRLMQLKAAMSMEKAAEHDGGAGEGLGLGMGFMLPGMMTQFFQQQSGQQQNQEQKCPDCGRTVPITASFCPYCGHQIVVIDQCPKCGKNLPANARFCPKCGTPVQTKEQFKYCSKCGFQNLTNAKFCNQCGEPLFVSS
jgi:membrane protease subunit (stomatin/prohibitin family)